MSRIINQYIKQYHIVAELKNEAKTVYFMIQLHCRKNHHSTANFCANCDQLLNYALLKLGKCPLRFNKPTCKLCPVHCYKKALKQEIKKVMVYSRPRLIFHKPLLALKYLIKSNYWKIMIKGKSKKSDFINV